MPRPRSHDDALRGRLLEVTSELVSTRGVDGVTVRGVARRAGTSASAVYALYGSKDDLLTAVVEEGFRRFAAHLDAAGVTDDPRADLLRLGLAYRRSALTDPHFYRVMFGTPPRSGAATARSTFGVLVTAVRRVLDDADGGRARVGDHDPLAGSPPDDVAVEVAVGLWAQVHGLVTLELTGLLPGTEEDHERRCTAILLRTGPAMLGAPAGGGTVPGPRTTEGPSTEEP